MKSKIVLACLFIAVGLSLYLTLLLIDAGISLDASRQNSVRLDERSRQALAFAEEKWIGAEKIELLVFAEKMHEKNIVVKDRGQTVEIGDLIFEINGSRVAKVRFLDDSF